MHTKEKVLFNQEQETLLIPLYSKATEKAIFHDPKAQEILEQVEYDFARLKVPRKTTITLCIRANKLDAYARQFLAEHPDGRVLHLGCGLDSRPLRVGGNPAEWYDLDLPMVIDLRRKFYTEAGPYRMIPSSVVDFAWLEEVSPAERPTLIVAEGLLMYLTEEQVRSLFLKLRERFPGCRIACDIFSKLTADRVGAHSSLKQTGASVHWGIDDAKVIEAWAPGIRLLEEWYFSQAQELSRLGGLYGFLFKLAGSFEAANKAHRIVLFQL